MTASVTRPRPPVAAQFDRALQAGLRYPSVLIGLVAFGLYLVPAVRVLQLNPDVVEYIDIARRLLNGDGYLLGIKAYHIGGTAVLHGGLAERPPLFPWLIAGLLGLGLDLRAIQIMNAALTALSVGLVAEIGSLLFGRTVGAASGILAAASPIILARMILPMSEAVTIALLLLAVWIVVRAPEPARRGDYLLAGSILGLGYFARPTVAACAAALIPAIVLGAHDRRRAIVGAGWLVLGVLIFVVPMSIYSLVTQGSLSYSGQSYLYSVIKDSDVLRNGYGRVLPSPLAFISENRDFVLVAIWENARDYATMMLTERDWLRPLALAWVGVLLALGLRAYPRRAFIPAAVIAATFATYALTWANFQERYQIPALLLLLPFLAHGLACLGLTRLRLGPLPRSLPLFAAVAVVCWVWLPTWRQQYKDEFRYGDEATKPRIDGNLRWTGPPRWSEDNELTRVNDWLMASTEPNDVVTHGQPWPYTFFTMRPSTLLPTKLSGALLRGFLTDYHVAYVLLDQRDRDRRDYRADLDDMAPDAVMVASFGSFRIFDTRALWAQGASAPR